MTRDDLLQLTDWLGDLIAAVVRAESSDKATANNSSGQPDLMFPIANGVPAAAEEISGTRPYEQSDMLAVACPSDGTCVAVGAGIVTAPGQWLAWRSRAQAQANILVVGTTMFGTNVYRSWILPLLAGNLCEHGRPYNPVRHPPHRGGRELVFPGR